jgi:hypothetical protein
MANLTESTVHYTKLSLANWTGKQDRYRVNQSLRVLTNPKMLQYTWHFTRELREMWNAVEEDIDWEGFSWAETQWKEIRKQYGRKVTLWVAKACHYKKFVPGAVQPNIRVPKTVSILAYIPSEDTLIQLLRMEDWIREFELYDVNDKNFNRIATWKNPATCVKGGTAPGGW